MAGVVHRAMRAVVAAGAPARFLILDNAADYRGDYRGEDQYNNDRTDIYSEPRKHAKQLLSRC